MSASFHTCPGFAPMFMLGTLAARGLMGIVVDPGSFASAVSAVMSFTVLAARNVWCSSVDASTTPLVWSNTMYARGAGGVQSLGAGGLGRDERADSEPLFAA